MLEQVDDVVFEEIDEEIIIPKRGASHCQGIPRKDCMKSNGCIWIPRKTMSNGKTRKGHCRKLKGK